MKLNFHISYDNPHLRIQSVSQILTAYALIHDGMGFMIRGDADEFVARYDREVRARMERTPWAFFWESLDVVPQELYRIGETMFEAPYLLDFGKSPLIPEYSTDLLLSSMASPSPPELVSISKGSLEGEIEKILEWIGRFFAGALASSSLLPEGSQAGGESLGYYLERLGTESPEPRLRYLGAGIITVGSGILAANYRELGVRSVKATVSDDDDDEKVYAVEDHGAY